MNLWRLCFNDPEEFVLWYFDKVYREENAMVCRDGGKQALAALQMIPYTVNYYQQSVEALYISGACTHPSHRNKGLMTQLLKESFQEMYQREIPLSILIPQEEWLFDYYRKMGYATLFDYAEELPQFPDLVAGEELPECVLLTSEQVDFEALFRYFDSRLNTRLFCVQHNRQDFENILEEHFRGGGKLWVVYDEQREITGMALGVPEEEGLKIVESYYDSSPAGEALKQAVLRETTAVRWKQRVNKATTHPVHYGMARVINVEKMLGYYAASYPGIWLTFEVRDAWIAENNAVFVIRHEKCKKEPLGTGGDKLPVFDIDILTQALFNYPDGTGRGAWMGLMLE